jgi:aerobic-type carbon monoxide dehydrogenase small subunit (CoxS/CutS family)
MKDKNNDMEVSRRGFIKGLGGGIAGATTLTSRLSEAAQTGPYGAAIIGPQAIEISLTINGQVKKITVDPRTTLLDALRNDMGLTGAKRVCNKGQCGSCTVILNGKTVLACSMLALDADGSMVETVEGLAEDGTLHPVQSAFVKYDAMQCGYCTPGFVMSSVSLLRENSQPTLADIKNGVAGNLCRCGTYPNIFKAVADAAKTMKKGG